MGRRGRWKQGAAGQGADPEAAAWRVPACPCIVPDGLPLFAPEQSNQCRSPGPEIKKSLFRSLPRTFVVARHLEIYIRTFTPWQDGKRQPSSLSFHRLQRQTPAILLPIALLVSLACHRSPRGHLSASRYHRQRAIAPISPLPHPERCSFPAQPLPPPSRPSLPSEPPTPMRGLSCPEAPSAGRMQRQLQVLSTSRPKCITRSWHRDTGF